MKNTFLSAQWKKLILANYTIDPSILLPYLPEKTELDFWEGKCYVSLVGFMFENVRVKGIKIPFHVNFEEVNLRFYVRYNDNNEWKRGAVFIKEIVPKHAITLVANTVYGEHYETLPMKHEWNETENQLLVSYSWKKNGEWQELAVKTNNVSEEIAVGSEEEFITEHYWGYTKRKNGKTSEYGVEHPRWDVFKTLDYTIKTDFEKNYGVDFAFLNSETPCSVFLADGSDIEVKKGSKLF